ncbi:hypothetical protein Bbelb_017330 [Branchiostoma belcheri]|nr:hypothetical protein Bbelb_017330 [Branchiostoma belcheri]
MANLCPTKDRVEAVLGTSKYFCGGRAALKTRGWTIAQLNPPDQSVLWVIYPTQSRLEMATASFGPSQNVSLNDRAGKRAQTSWAGRGADTSKGPASTRCLWDLIARIDRANAASISAGPAA